MNVTSSTAVPSSRHGHRQQQQHLKLGRLLVWSVVVQFAALVLIIAACVVHVVLSLLGNEWGGHVVIPALAFVNSVYIVVAVRRSERDSLSTFDAFSVGMVFLFFFIHATAYPFLSINSALYCNASLVHTFPCEYGTYLFTGGYILTELCLVAQCGIISLLVNGIVLRDELLPLGVSAK